MRIYFIFCFFLLTEILSAQITSPFNKLTVEVDSSSEYSFFVSGHFHGSSKNTSGLPAKTVLNNIAEINDAQPKFIVSLGDLFLDVKNDIKNYTDTLFNKLHSPLFNVVGNHDLSGSVYQDKYGELYFSFTYKTEKFIFLDTETNDGSIVNDQKKFLQAELANISGIKNIFIFSHRLIWAEDHPELKNLFLDNTRSSKPGNFRTEILPELQKVPKSISILFGGGSMGNVPAPFFFHSENNITYFATAIRDTPKDAFLKVTVNDGKISFSSFALPMSPEYYNLKYYNPQEKKSNPFNWRLVPLYTKQAVSHRYFWYGVICIIIPCIMIWLLFKRKRKKKIG